MLNREFADSLKKSGIFCALLAVLIIAFQTVFPERTGNYVWYLYGYFSLLTVLSLFLVMKGIGKDPQDFYNYSMGSVAVRLFVSSAVLFVYYYAVKDKQTRIGFTAAFFILYFCYTGFEIRILLSKLRPDSGKNEPKR